MPGLGGPEVIHRLRRGDGSLPFGVLVVTGAAEIVAPLRGELGHDAVLEKPFDIVTLADRVKTLAGIPEGSGEPPGGVRGTRHGLPGESQGAPEIKEPT